MVFRSWVAVWVATLLIFITPVLQNINISTFFAALVLYVVPPAAILMIYILASFSLLVGMCLAWAWGLVAMKAALAARPNDVLQAQLGALKIAVGQRLNETGIDPRDPKNTDMINYIKREFLYNGFILDARVTVVYYVMCCVFIYWLARVRMKNDSLLLFQIFGTIVIDIFLLTGPLLSQDFLPTLPKVLVEPGAIGVGIGLVLCIFLYPQSTSHVVLDCMEKLVKLTGAATDSTRRRLNDQAVHIDELVALKAKTVGLYKAMKPALAFLPIDLSRGRWGVDDVKGLHVNVRAAMSASLSLLDFHIVWIFGVSKAKALRERNAESRQAADGDAALPKQIGSHQLEEYMDLLEALKAPGQSEKFDAIRVSLLNTTADVLNTAHDATGISARAIHMANSNRWIRTPKQEVFDAMNKEMTDCLAKLRESKERCIRNTNNVVIEHHADLFDADGKLKTTDDLHPGSLQGIVLSMVIEERILAVVTAMEDLLAYLIRLGEERKTHRMWFPRGIQYFVNWVFHGELVLPITADGAAPDAVTAEDPENPIERDEPENKATEAYRRLRASHLAKGRKVRRGLFSKAMIGFYGWLTNPAGMYALRVTIVTIATSIPAALPQTAGFFYREKGIWGVITAQTCVLVYMADFTFSLFGRGLGTVIGGVMGMVAWYIGSGGLGDGNPYGLGATTAVFSLILIWWRLFLPAAWLQATVMVTSTFMLVIGFSYDAAHIPYQYGLPGIGYEAFWKRLVVVLLGFVASLIVQIFPKPPSATVHISKTLSNVVGTLSDHYALLLSHWGRSGESPISAVAEDISINVSDRLMGLAPSLTLLNIEISSSSFDKASLTDISQHVELMNQCLSKLLEMSTTLPQDWQQRLGTSTGLTDSRVIGQVMAVLGIVEGCLRTGAPVPERLPSPLVRNIYESWAAQHRSAILTTDLVRDENYRRYCVAISAYLQLLTILDDLVYTLKKCLGESHIVHSWEETA